jgi:predicted DNA-binding protein
MGRARGRPPLSDGAVPIGIRLGRSSYDWLKRQAATEGRSAAQIVRDIVDQHIEDDLQLRLPLALPAALRRQMP